MDARAEAAQEAARVEREVRELALSLGGRDGDAGRARIACVLREAAGTLATLAGELGPRGRR